MILLVVLFDFFPLTHSANPTKSVLKSRIGQFSRDSLPCAPLGGRHKQKYRTYVPYRYVVNNVYPRVRVYWYLRTYCQGDCGVLVESRQHVMPEPRSSDAASLPYCTYVHRYVRYVYTRVRTSPDAWKNL